MSWKEECDGTEVRGCVCPCTGTKLDDGGEFLDGSSGLGTCVGMCWSEVDDAAIDCDTSLLLHLLKKLTTEANLPDVEARVCPTGRVWLDTALLPNISSYEGGGSRKEGLSSWPGPEALQDVAGVP